MTPKSPQWRPSRKFWGEEMTVTITDLAYRVALVTQTLSADPAVEETLKKSGMNAARIGEGRKTLVDAFATLAEVAHHADDHTAIEQARRAMVELENWYHTERVKLAKASRLQGWDKLVGMEIEGPTWEFTVLMRAWRLISVARAPEVAEALAAKFPRLSDAMQRGATLSLKASKLLQKQHALRKNETRDGIDPPRLEKLHIALEKWLLDVYAAAEKGYAKDATAFALLGTLPESAEPFGGTGFDIMRHQRAQTTPPSRTPAEPCNGWGQGAGGNKENYWA
ncbi:MAG: hypothetical protein CO108_18735 [Deltaproteobacteria bacterium CG_4_9_14_3_um_filter_63_12]|nr:MAG: hypothetical protein CO108_18735 [Deltaproteobacteria bacterium CG_4_9_14_3_um_filter_63_12]